jgi:inorganic pyrophosphatase
METGDREVSREFWDYLDRLVATSRVVVDHPRDSVDPRYADIVYPADYGCLEGTASMDGAGIDVWVGASGDTRRVAAIICTVNLGKRDSEIKLLLGCSREETAVILRQHNVGQQRGVLIRRP